MVTNVDTLSIDTLVMQTKIVPVRLFLPLTFYHDVAHQAFSPSAPSLTPEQKALLYMYLRHPEGVTTTQTELQRKGGTLTPGIAENTLPEVIKQPELPLPQDPQPEDVDFIVRKPNFWTMKGEWYLQFLQNYVSDNWYKSGESNYSAVGAATFEFNYNNKQKVKWENKLEMKLGLMTSRSDSLHKFKTTEDLLRYTGKLGLQATKQWYYTCQLIAYTQFVRGYKSNDPRTYSDFTSPLNVNLSIGIDYTANWLKGKLTGTAHFAPLAGNLVYVGREALAKKYGVKDGHRSLLDYGSQLTLDLTWKPSNTFKWQSRLYGYTTYHRALVEWENTLTLQVNRYIGAKLFIYPRFDDNTKPDEKYRYFQLKELASIGFSMEL